MGSRPAARRSKAASSRRPLRRSAQASAAARRASVTGVLVVAEEWLRWVTGEAADGRLCIIAGVGPGRPRVERYLVTVRPVYKEQRTGT